jgi:L-ascorbate metabolism protein UlaG (beta-lactamase superfamily)
MDGHSVLLDGVCKAYGCYRGTPEELLLKLTEDLPDVVAFTHDHLDHYDDGFAKLYEQKTGRKVLDWNTDNSVTFGPIKITAIPTRHLGKNDTPHVSFILEGSSCIWFAGDGTPNELCRLEGFPKPDVLIVPYAYATTNSSFVKTAALGAHSVVIVHLPDREQDQYRLYDTVNKITEGCTDPEILIPDIGESLSFPK